MTRVCETCWWLLYCEIIINICYVLRSSGKLQIIFTESCFRILQLIHLYRVAEKSMPSYQVTNKLY